jgi:hypothetical protein
MTSKEQFSKIKDPLFRDLNMEISTEELKCLQELVKHIKDISNISKTLNYNITNATLIQVLQLF